MSLGLSAPAVVHFSSERFAILFVFSECLKDMEFEERNKYLAEEWQTSLTEDERTDFNTHTRTTEVIPRVEQIKRTMTKMKHLVNRILIYICASCISCVKKKFNFMQ